MKHSMKFLPAALALCTAAAARAGLYGDTPDARHAWAVHDSNRPNPVKITADPGRPPSDAAVLFDGTEESLKKNWKFARKPWRFADGVFESVSGAGLISTKQAFGDCQLHVEWASPAKVRGTGQGRGNSGVFLMGKYEIQVLDSYETDPAFPGKNPNYADGQAAAVYGQNPPLVNASRAPGEWQSYDIVFHQPVWEGGRVKWPGTMTVFHNGVLVQDNWELEGFTGHKWRIPLKPHAAKLPLQLQDHGNPVRYRNIWIREIPPRCANTTHGGPAVDEAAVAALRAKTAAGLFAKINLDDASRARALHKLLEVLSYDKSEKYLAALDKTGGAFLAELAALDRPALLKRKGEIFGVKNACDLLVRNRVFGNDFPLRAGLLKIIADKKLK